MRVRTLGTNRTARRTQRRGCSTLEVSIDVATSSWWLVPSLVPSRDADVWRGNNGMTRPPRFQNTVLCEVQLTIDELSLVVAAAASFFVLCAAVD